MTVRRLAPSAGLWLLAVFVVDVLGVYFEKRLKTGSEESRSCQPGG